MKKYAFLLIAVLAALQAISQSQLSIKVSPEIKTTQRTNNITLIGADETGIYITDENVALEKYTVFSAKFGDLRHLYKLDHNFKQIYDVDFPVELKSRTFHSFQLLNGGLYMFTASYSDARKELTLEAAKIDGETGKLESTFEIIGVFPARNKNAGFYMSVKSLADQDAFMVTSRVSYINKTAFNISLVDPKMNAFKSISIDSALGGSFYFWDVALSDDHVYIAGANSDKGTMTSGFVNVFDSKGAAIKSISVDEPTKFMINGRLIANNKEIVFAALYSANNKREAVNGAIVKKLNGQNELTTISEKPVSSLKEITELNEDTKYAKRMSKGDGKTNLYPTIFRIKSNWYDKTDKSTIFTAESSRRKTTNRTLDGHSYSLIETYYGNLFAFKVDAQGMIQWVNTIYKSQFDYDYGASNYDWDAPHSSYSTLVAKGKLFVVYSDVDANNVKKPSDAGIETADDFDAGSSLVAVGIGADGKMEKQVLAPNSKDNSTMPRHAVPGKENLVVPSFRFNGLAKTKIVLSVIKAP